MLLAADADRFDFGGIGFGATQGLPDGCSGRFAPSMRMLFLRARRQVRNQFVCLRAGGQNLSIASVDGQNFRRLGAAIDSEHERSHKRSEVPRMNNPAAPCPILSELHLAVTMQ